MLSLPSAYTRAPPLCSDIMPSPVIGASPLTTTFHEPQSPSAIASKGFWHCPFPYQPNILPHRLHGHLINDSILMGCYGNGNASFPQFQHLRGHNNEAEMSSGIGTSLAHKHMSASSDQVSFCFQESSIHNTLPPFSVFGSLCYKNNHSTLVRQSKANYEPMAKPSHQTQHRLHGGSQASTFLKEQKTLKAFNGNLPTKSTPCDQHHHQLSKREGKFIIAKSKEPAVSQVKKLRHSIASILNIQTCDSQEMTKGEENYHIDDKVQKERIDDELSAKVGAREAQEERSDVVDEITQDNLRLHGNPARENSAKTSSDCFSTGSLKPVSENAVATTLNNKNNRNMPEKGTSNGTESLLETKIVATHESRLENSVHHVNDAHLERVECVQTTQDRKHFKDRDDLFTPHLPNSNSELRAIKTNYKQDVGLSANMAGATSVDQSDRARTTALAPMPLDISVLPVSRSNYQSEASAASKCLDKAFALTQTLRQSPDQPDHDERSAFKPIVKSWTVSRPQSDLSNSYLKSQQKYSSSPGTTSLSVPGKQIYFDSDKREPGSFTSETTREINLQVDNKAASGRSKMNAISMLRHRSSVYQRHEVNNALSFSAAGTSSPEHLPSTFGAWLSWLRRREVSSELLNRTTSPRVPPPPRYYCDACNKTYSTFGGLSKHRQFHCAQCIKKEFACKVCSKSYSSLGALKMHIRTHTLPCKCHVCGKAFSRPWLLQGHVRTHTGEKPFRCSHCGRAFADRSNLRAHLQTHADIKKYACLKCGKTFSRMSLLTKHTEGSCPGNVRAITDISQP